jgi:hypothetical protein
MLRRYPVLLLCLACVLGVAAGVLALLHGEWFLALGAYATTIVVLAATLRWLAKSSEHPPRR